MLTRISTEDLKATIAAVKAAGNNQTKAADELGISRSTLQNRLKQAINRKMEIKADVTPTDVKGLRTENAALRDTITRMTEAANSKWKPRKVTKQAGKDDTVRVIMPDSHGAYADETAMGVFIHDLGLLKPDELVMMGDHVDCAGFLSSHGALYVAEGEYTYEEDIAACRRHVDLIQEATPGSKIRYLEGNHEARVEAWCVDQTHRNKKDADFLRRQCAPNILLGLEQRGIEFFRRSQCYDGLTVAGAIKLGKCMFVHDTGESNPRASLAEYGGSVVQGHNHRSMSYIRSTVAQGDIGFWSFGCLAKKWMYWHHSKKMGHSSGYGVQLVNRSGNFLTISVPIIDGLSYLGRLLGSRI